MKRLVVAGTDTDVGKTVFAAALASATDRFYWKPVQAGIEGGGDSARVAALGVSRERILPEAYRLKTPASPHYAAEVDGLTIDLARLDLPKQPCVVETAGGVLVPVTRDTLYADIMARWGAPIILVARTALGTINHSLLSLEALRARDIDVSGVAFVGPENADSERTICEVGNVQRLGRLPILPQLNAVSLDTAFRANFDFGHFA